MKKILLIVLFILLAYTDAYSYANSIHNELKNNVIRLHVIANSDKEKDQMLKLQVRDAILDYMKEKDYENYEVAYFSIANSLSDMEKIAKNTLEKFGCQDDVKVSLGQYDFPLKHYHNLSFPAGKYTALRITIGEAKGHNWWCVMYPALCFSDNVCDTQNAVFNLQNSLSKEAFQIIAGNHQLKFKMIEFFQK